MAIKKGKNKLRRCQKKPKRSTINRNSIVANDSDDHLARLANGGYRKLGRSGFENYSKHMARVWWDLPHVARSGLLMETSKHRIRGGPPHNQDNENLTQGYPQPHYTFKVLKTAFKIYRIRMKKRYMKSRKIKKEWLWSNKTRNEEPKWANILDKPLFEQYVLLLQYIRNLASKIAREKGHHEVICSATPLQVLEQLHPLLHLDFRGSKHYLPKPFVESSDSDTQLKIDYELNKLDRALADKRICKDEFDTKGMAEKEEFISSTSSLSSSDEDLNEEEKYARGTTKYHLKGDSVNGIKLLEREGEIYESYRDPDSENSVFLDFTDLGEETQEKGAELILNNIDELLKHYDIRERNSISRRRRSTFEGERRALVNEEPNIFGSSTFGNFVTSSGRRSNNDSINSRLTSRYTNIFGAEPRPGPSSQTDDLEGEEYHIEETNMNSNETNLNTVTHIQSNGDTCTLTVSCHGDHIPAKLRSTKRISQNTTTIDAVDGINEGQIITAAGDASNIIASRTTTNEVILNGNLQNSIESLNNLLFDMAKFAETSNRNLDKIEKSIIKIENVIPNVNICNWNDIKRHIRLIIKRYPRITA